MNRDLIRSKETVGKGSQKNFQEGAADSFEDNCLENN